MFPNRSGLASIVDLQCDEWAELFAELESFQSLFLAHEGAFRSRDYVWPTDALHNWSRLWEYPYALYHIRRELAKCKAERIVLVDLGSGVTFFPLFLANSGLNVVTIDNDPLCEIDYPRACTAMGVDSALLRSITTSAIDTRLPDESVDVVYCISVLEHIPDPKQVISEVARILKPDGLFILTMDIDLQGDRELSAEEYANIMMELRRLFYVDATDETIHPNNMLTSKTSPIRFGQIEPLAPLVATNLGLYLRRLMVNPFAYFAHAINVMTSPRVGAHLACYGGIWRKPTAALPSS